MTSPPHLTEVNSALSMPRPHVLKHGECFAVFDAWGDAGAAPHAAEGLFFEDTRYISYLVLAINGARPLVLSSAVRDDNSALVVDMAGPPAQGDQVRPTGDVVHLLKTISVGDEGLVLHLEMRNFAMVSASLQVAFEFDADFVDVFELRGTPRQKRGRRLDDETANDKAILAYAGRDDIIRRTRIGFMPPPSQVLNRRAQWHIELPPKGTWSATLSAQCERSEKSSRRPAGAPPPSERRVPERTEIRTDSEPFNEVIARSRADIDMLITETSQGPVAYAGLPWFSTSFGRDALITAFECLWLDPMLAVGTLRYLATTQATAIDKDADAEPGKILHETRKGEMSMLGEVPFRRYYGSVDATPLFVMLAAAYHAETGDVALIHEIWPNIEAALAWMSGYGDADGDGFLEYDRRSINGLVNQGWKDSGDAIFHADGRLVEPPVTLAEVQAYAYAAFRGAAVLAGVLGQVHRQSELTAAAAKLQRAFEAAFWIEDLDTYALALDGGKRPCRVRTSNAGQVLFGGIASAQRARRVANTLMTPRLFSRWGIRTVADDEVRYNPMSYHDGSVWPHDNGLIAMGFGRYGLKQPIVALLDALSEAARFMPMRRLPEFFCGFARRSGIGPTVHPAACAPQAWASASVIGMLGALLGVSLDPAGHQVLLREPVLPAGINRMMLSNLRLGSATMDLQLQRRGEGVDVRVVRRDGEIDVVVTN